MANVWGITEDEYRRALRLSRDQSITEADRQDYFQLVRFYLGQIFYRDSAARAARRLRGEAA